MKGKGRGGDYHNGLEMKDGNHYKRRGRARANITTTEGKGTEARWELYNNKRGVGDNDTKEWSKGEMKGKVDHHNAKVDER